MWHQNMERKEKAIAEWGLNLEMGFHVVKRMLEMGSL
ncbi:hypothetical protein TorRG33x02_135400 [Trema orientale]|uniref:Uncharacterized protein n=1 Tax=Trema orientale TaxID=63057 RepID=A0A2P5EYS1_TREOI|nr:hypothetical protein TorRG33x02_135400 [Trema orientale]